MANYCIVTLLAAFFLCKLLASLCVPAAQIAPKCGIWNADLPLHSRAPKTSSTMRKMTQKTHGCHGSKFYLWVNRSIGVIRVVGFLFWCFGATCVLLGWLKCSVCACPRRCVCVCVNSAVLLVMEVVAVVVLNVCVCFFCYLLAFAVDR